ncbi:hypothetical protein SAMN04488543_0794 [Friedmanniella luteola]|uniref:Uncharacterized protein n=1 Tax=Friedmanniella luteola TaxID=546871 RepID=A0A1H1N7T1_9ACTN|nr:hypothetical protein [Friedmanniella luteola]SDR94249.1 hypothetical protein SAMN04488543_0794 [Friedmanniella luteola]
MILLDLDPNVVKPGWTPLLITIGIALVMVLLFRSMRRQFRRVDANFPEPATPVGLQPDEPVTDPASDVVDERPVEGDAGSPPAPDGRART